MKLQLVSTILTIINLCFVVWLTCDNIHLRSENAMLKQSNQICVQVIKGNTATLRRLNQQ